LYPFDGFKNWYKTEETDQMVYSNGSMCAPKLGTVLAMHFREVVITVFIASAVARGKTCDPTTMLAHSAVEVEVARTTTCMEGASARRTFIGVKSTSSTMIWLLFPKAAVPARCTDA
jgi:hypothetical protein